MIIIEKYIEVIQNLLPLLDTMEEGILHSKKQILELRYEEASNLLEDVLVGVKSINNAIQPMMGESLEGEIVAIGEVLEEELITVIHNYKKGKKIDLERQVENIILPTFKDWKNELRSALRPYIIS